MKRPLKILVPSVILYFFVLAVYLLGQAVLDQHGLEYRSWVSALGFFWIYILPFPAGAVLLLALYRHLKARFPGKAFRTFCVIVFVIYLLAAVCLMGFLGFIRLLTAPQEEALDSGYLKVYTNSFPTNTWYYCSRYSFFARRPLTDAASDTDGRYEDLPSSGFSSTGEDDSSGDSDADSTFPSGNPDAGSTSPSGNPDAGNSPVPDSNPSSDAGDTSDLSIPENAARTVYEAVFQQEGKTYQETYNAKGNLYIVLDTYDTVFQEQDVTARETLVYDRVSENGRCQLFVYYQEHYDSSGNQLDNTSILNFYAVDMTTGQVTAADKTSWSESASEAYHQATGEY